jgi:ferredoxin
MFAAGDIIRGPSNFVQAVADGQKAAFYIDYYLQKSVHRVDDVNKVKASEIKVTIPSDVEEEQRQRMPVLPAPERVRGFEEVETGFSPEMAIAEAKRCLNCAGHLCKNVCPYDVPRFTNSGRIHIVKCNLCTDRLGEGKNTACVAACPVEALDAGPMDEIIAKHGELRTLENFADYRSTRPSIVFRTRG